MSRQLNRRDFTKVTSAGVGGMLAGSLMGTRPAIGQEQDHAAPQNRLILLGLNGLREPIN